VSLPNPLPDNPHRWDGWKNYNSNDPYERLCLRFDSNPSQEQIEGNCRQLLIWWQKKLPLKSQPSNPVAQMLRGGLDEAPKYLAEAKTILLDAEARARIDAKLHQRAIDAALEEFRKLLTFAISDSQLTEQDEERLNERGRSLGLSPADVIGAIEAELKRVGAARVSTPVAPPPLPPPTAYSDAPATAARGPGEGNPADEFRRILKMSRLCLEGEEMSDDQRDAMCNLGESLGLTGGQAEDLIDEYLEEMSMAPAAPGARTATPPVRTAAAVVVAPRPAMTQTVAPAPPKPEPVAKPIPVAREINVTPLGRSIERQQFPNFTNLVGMEMLLVTSGQFVMGSAGSSAQQNEQPLTTVKQAGFYCARFPVTNAQFEEFDPAHRMKRAPWADDRHPVIYVSS
jgi:hypothetical protein